MVIFINVVGLLLIVLVIYWFWIYKPKIAKLVTSDHVKVTVEKGVYTPDIIKARVGKLLTLEFLLKDPSHCAATVIFSDFDVSKELTLDKTETVTITPDKVGEFDFACPMGMYRGNLIVEQADEATTDSIDVVIDGGVYTPAAISIPVGSPVTLRFTRKDESHCAETVVMQDFGVSEAIPLDEAKEITITAEHPGVYEFHCPMGMYKGKLIAE